MKTRVEQRGRGAGGGNPADCRPVIRRLLDRLREIDFSTAAAFVYNPMDYAGDGFFRYWRTFATAPKQVVLVGMNPGPWGMAQTGVPFGEVEAVRDWMRLSPAIGQPERVHPLKPVRGLDCPRREVSGRRLWGWARQRFGTPEAFFSRFFVLNYCPLMFLDHRGRNVTPDKLPAGIRRRLQQACDAAVSRLVGMLRPDWVVAVGAWTHRRLEKGLEGYGGRLGRITHPSPANPRANRDWQGCVEQELRQMGVELPWERRS